LFTSIEDLMIATSRPHWSYNQLSKYLRCSLAYYFEYVVKLPKSFTSSGQVLGSAVHEALATYHRSILGGRPCDRETVMDAFLKAWTEREARETIRYSEGGNRDDILEQGGSVLGVYLQGPPPSGIVAVEEPFLSPIVSSEGDVLEKPLVSILDLLTRESTGLTITDFKTSGRSMSAMEAETSLQATCYANAVDYTFAEQVRFQFVVLVKTRTPKIQNLPTARSETDIGRLGDLVQVVERAIAAKVFYPVETPLNCSTCCYRKECREWTSTSGVSTRVSLPTVGEEDATCSLNWEEKEGASVNRPGRANSIVH
jgi:putative RecB family exonuclease